MISIYNLKPKFQALLKPVLELLHSKGVTANQITIASVLWSFLVAAFFWFADSNSYFFLALPIGLFVRMALNALDGMMARIYKQQSKLGEILNELGDVISDVVLFIPLLKFEPNALYFIVIFICMSIINEFAGILAKVVTGERRYDGPMGKSDRAFMIGFYGLLCFFGYYHYAFSSYIFIALIALVGLSTFTRLKKAVISN
ncbi:CDP-alcohol phosphatidyltransferase family protein [Flavobacterium muglaense]|uniref:CDP-alcohol phosphatidyltransferase family protein n=1 Tax=Flavobacterium muglaense TaxID=2764716 RepID=A0A923SH46_9FLAO|nr:CDP-alcohol phosphatidyltransferase family protein [Flavobacterium muglaense]MBC5839738.1 CDP-alcohol phosphatidyltransferase family protein [Flavobacterium muglaense]MBC5846265.1 CDP-alcohol phosphatidyltransferase family protein [Flavobacterium muglaense]